MASRAVSATRYSSTSHLKLQYQIAYTKKGTDNGITGGFICPPIGVIDSSVLTAVGMLLAFAILAQIPTLIEAAKGGKTIRLQKADFSAEVSSEND